MRPEGFVDGNTRDRLDRAGVPRSLARGTKDLYLHEFVRDPDLSTAEAAANVGANRTRCASGVTDRRRSSRRR